MDVDTAPRRRPYRVAVLNTHPIQYFAPWYAYLNASGEFEITALYCSDFSLRGEQDKGFGQRIVWDLDLLSGYQAIFLGERAKTRVPSGFWSLVCPEIWREIRDGEFDALIVHGHGHAVNLLAIVAAKITGVRVFMRGDTNIALQRRNMKSSLTRLFKEQLYRFVDGCLAAGTRNIEFYKSLNVLDDHIFLLPFSVDNKRVAMSADSGALDRDKILNNVQLKTDTPVIVFASKLQKLKHPEHLIRAASVLKTRGYAFSLLIVGSGEMEVELKGLCTQLSLSAVSFVGFVNQSELPRLFGASDIFVLPSENDQWGLVVNEAMCAGLPVVVADGVGCVPDLVYDSENGYVFKAGDVDGLVGALEPLLADEELRRRMGQRSREIIAGWSYAECQEGLRKAMEAWVPTKP